MTKSLFFIPFSRVRPIATIASLLLLLSACGGGSGGDSNNPPRTPQPTSSTPAAVPCNTPDNQLSQSGKQYTLIQSTSFCANIYFETSNATLAADQADILADINSALSAINRLMLIKNFNLLVNSDNALIEPMRGTGGRAFATKAVEIGIDYTVATLDHITFIIAREAIRSRRTQNHSLDSTLLQALVTEGLAIAFAIEITQPLVLPPEATAIATVDYDATVLSALAELNSSSYDYGAWFLGTGARTQYTGHTLGYDMVQRFLSRHPGSKAAYAFSVNASLFTDYVEPIDPMNPVQVLKASQSVRTPDLAGLPPGLEQVPVTDFADQANAMRGDYFLEGLTHRKTVALTFDDGPTVFTSNLINLLATNNVKATFFMMGSTVQSSPQIAIDALNNGHTLANHTLEHRHNSGRDPAELWQNSLNPTSNIFESVLGFRPRLFRPSYGEISNAQVNFLAEQNMKTILWSIDTRDWHTSAVFIPDIINAANNHMHEEAIILMHDGGGDRNNTVNAVQSIIDHYKSNGYDFVTIDEMLGVSAEL